MNTLDEAFDFARSVREEPEQEQNTRATLRIFETFTENRLEALIAFLIWKARGQRLQKILHRRKPSFELRVPLRLR